MKDDQQHGCHGCQHPFLAAPARPGEVAVVFAGRAAMLVTNAAFLRLGWHRST
jgi:hypothetical protein